MKTHTPGSMNRLIKFRAWNDFGNGQGEMVTEESHRLTSAQILSRFSTVMQFTGLTDRSGTEIYEGDVIEVNIPHRRTQTHTGDNIPLGSYTEPLEPAIERKVGVVVFHVNSFLLIEQGWVQEFIEATAEGVNINAFESVNLEWLNDAVIPDFLWASDIDAVAAKELFNGGWGRFEWEGEEGELAFLLDELGLGSEAELIFYLQPRVLGSIHTHAELVDPNP